MKFKIGIQSESDELYLVQTEDAHLKETIIALREELQKLDAQNEESVQKANWPSFHIKQSIVKPYK